MTYKICNKEKPNEEEAADDETSKKVRNEKNSTGDKSLESNGI